MLDMMNDYKGNEKKIQQQLGEKQKQIKALAAKKKKLNRTWRNSETK